MLLLRSIRKKLQSNGFDLCDPIHTAWYNKLIANEGLVESGALKILPEPSSSVLDDESNDDMTSPSTSPSYNAVLVGNTKTIWPSFIDWLAMKVGEKKRQHMDDIKSSSSCSSISRDDDGSDMMSSHERAVEDVIHSNPFDTYCEESLSRSLQELLYHSEDASKSITSYDLFWSNGKRQKVTISNNNGHHQLNNVSSNEVYHCYNDTQDSFLVSMQRIASVTGQYWHDEANTKLCVHPLYGTWTAFRALVVFETTENLDNSDERSSGNRSTPLSVPTPPPPPPPCPCPVLEEEMEEAKKIFDYAMNMTDSGSDNNNIGSYGTQSNKSWAQLCTFLHNQVCQGSDWDEVPESMKPWIELRNVISTGRDDWKYDEAQLLYHYTKDPNILRKELSRIV
ncbi:hypothetical protein ACHAWC_007823 [Mediolabrus comicus]